MVDKILAGPILRSTTKNRICVWLALDSEQDITLEILDVKSKQALGKSELEKIAKSRFKLGDKLFVYLLQAFPNDPAIPFETGQLLYYRLQDGQGKELDLKKAKLTYGTHKYPLFHIPEKLTSVLHGSCRKPHGDDKDDALAVGDTVLENSFNDIGTRPDLLLLTGDQIYADDVEASLLSVLREQAKTLTGSYENLPTQEQPDPKKQVLDINQIKLGERAKVLEKNKSGFSSDAADNHLISFGEFAAMYLYVFGNASAWQKPGTWEEIKQDHIDLKHTIKLTDHLSRCGFKSNAEIIAKKEQALQEKITAVNTFSNADSMLKVRRLLANIPTYMIFDDHDVTDDWNITGHWYDKVRSSPLGRRIVSNALAAYWAFQGWGNDPDNFDGDLISAITAHVEHPGDTSIGDHYDLMTWKHRGWGFTIETDPPIIAMDSRTQRESEVPYYPPRLMDRYALDWLRVEWSKLKASNKQAITKDTCPIIIATTPVLGFSPVEHIIRFVLWVVSHLENTRFIAPVEKLLKIEGFISIWMINFLDEEAWTANLDGFTALLDTLVHNMQIKQCVFLSGDVHYSFTLKGFYKSRKHFSAPQRTLHCYQLTSSSLRNEPSLSLQKALDELEKFEDRNNLWQKLKRQVSGLQFLRGWQEEHQLLAPNQPIPAQQVVAENPLAQHKLCQVFSTQSKRLKPVWDTLVKYKIVPGPVDQERVAKQCNLGQVFFDQGLPHQHRLLIDPNDASHSIDYDLPKLP